MKMATKPNRSSNVLCNSQPVSPASSLSFPPSPPSAYLPIHNDYNFFSDNTGGGWSISSIQKSSKNVPTPLEEHAAPSVPVTDVVGSLKHLKDMFSLPCSPEEISLKIFRVGETLLIDEAPTEYKEVVEEIVGGVPPHMKREDGYTEDAGNGGGSRIFPEMLFPIEMHPQKMEGRVINENMRGEVERNNETIGYGIGNRVWENRALRKGLEEMISKLGLFDVHDEYTFARSGRAIELSSEPALQFMSNGRSDMEEEQVMWVGKSSCQLEDTESWIQNLMQKTDCLKGVRVEGVKEMIPSVKEDKGNDRKRVTLEDTCLGSAFKKVDDFTGWLQLKGFEILNEVVAKGVPALMDTVEKVETMEKVESSNSAPCEVDGAQLLLKEKRENISSEGGKTDISKAYTQEKRTHRIDSSIFGRAVKWDVGPFRIFLGDDWDSNKNPLYRLISSSFTGNGTSISRKERLNLWLENLMLSINRVVLCRIRNGTLNKLYLVGNEEIPLLHFGDDDEDRTIKAENSSVEVFAEDSELYAADDKESNSYFDAEFMNEQGRRFLYFLRNTCVREGGMYWLYKEKNSRFAKLYDVTDNWNFDASRDPLSFEAARVCFQMAGDLHVSIKNEEKRLNGVTQTQGLPATKIHYSTLIRLRQLLAKGVLLLNSGNYPELAAAAYSQLAIAYFGYSPSILQGTMGTTNQNIKKMKDDKKQKEEHLESFALLCKSLSYALKYLESAILIASKNDRSKRFVSSEEEGSKQTEGMNNRFPTFANHEEMQSKPQQEATDGMKFGVSMSLQLSNLYAIYAECCIKVVDCLNGMSDYLHATKDTVLDEPLHASNNHPPWLPNYTSVGSYFNIWKLQWLIKSLTCLECLPTELRCVESTQIQHKLFSLMSDLLCQMSALRYEKNRREMRDVEESDLCTASSEETHERCLVYAEVIECICKALNGEDVDGMKGWKMLLFQLMPDEFCRNNIELEDSINTQRVKESLEFEEFFSLLNGREMVTSIERLWCRHPYISNWKSIFSKHTLLLKEGLYALHFFCFADEFSKLHAKAASPAATPAVLSGVSKKDGTKLTKHNSYQSTLRHIKRKSLKSYNSSITAQLSNTLRKFYGGEDSWTHVLPSCKVEALRKYGAVYNLIGQKAILDAHRVSRSGGGCDEDVEASVKSQTNDGDPSSMRVRYQLQKFSTAFRMFLQAFVCNALALDKMNCILILLNLSRLFKEMAVSSSAKFFIKWMEDEEGVVDSYTEEEKSFTAAKYSLYMAAMKCCQIAMGIIKGVAAAETWSGHELYGRNMQIAEETKDIVEAELAYIHLTVAVNILETNELQHRIDGMNGLKVYKRTNEVLDVPKRVKVTMLNTECIVNSESWPSLWFSWEALQQHPWVSLLIDDGVLLEGVMCDVDEGFADVVRSRQSGRNAVVFKTVWDEEADGDECEEEVMCGPCFEIDRTSIIGMMSKTSGAICLQHFQIALNLFEGLHNCKEAMVVRFYIGSFYSKQLAESHREFLKGNKLIQALKVPKQTGLAHFREVLKYCSVNYLQDFIKANLKMAELMLSYPDENIYETLGLLISSEFHLLKLHEKNAAAFTMQSIEIVRQRNASKKKEDLYSLGSGVVGVSTLYSTICQLLKKLLDEDIPMISPSKRSNRWWLYNRSMFDRHNIENVSNILKEKFIFELFARKSNKEFIENLFSQLLHKQVNSFLYLLENKYG